MGGNYLLNIGPMSDGTVVPYERDVLNGVGEWVSQHNEAFYNTKANPFRKLNWGYSTVKAEENVIRLFPPLIVENQELDEAINKIQMVCKEMS